MASTQQVEITYVGNMGCLVGIADKKFLVDGLHKSYRPEYSFPPQELVNRIIAGKESSFSGIAASCVTHVHRDHFDAGFNAAFLSNNLGSILVMPQQAYDSLPGNIKTASATKRIRIATPYSTEKVQVFSQDGYRLHAFVVNHINQRRHREIQNIGYIIEYQGVRVFHAGDTDIDPGMYATLSLSQYKIHVAIVPDWMLTIQEGAEIVREHIRPELIIATHISPLGKESIKKAVHKKFPEAIVFTEIMQQISFRSPSLILSRGKEAGITPQGVYSAVQDYVEASYKGDSSKMIRSVSPAIDNVGYYKQEGNPQYSKQHTSYPEIIDYSKQMYQQEKIRPPGTIRRVEILDNREQIASVKLTAWWGTD